MGDQISLQEFLAGTKQGYLIEAQEASDARGSALGGRRQ